MLYYRDHDQIEVAVVIEKRGRTTGGGGNQGSCYPKEKGF
jgi:hypothetical protein